MVTRMRALTACLCGVWLLCCLGMQASIASQKEAPFKIEGIRHDLLENAEARLVIYQKEQVAFSARSKPSRKQLTAASQEIKLALEPYGYFRAHVNAQAVFDREKGWSALFYVRKGPRLKVTRVSVLILGPGSDNQKLDAFRRHFPIKSGDAFQASVYTAAKDKLYQIANNQGYLKSAFTEARIVIDLVRYSAVITLIFQTGHRYYFGETSFGRSPYATHFLKRFISYRETDPFSNERLIDLQQAMASSAYFQGVSLTPDFARVQNYHVPVKMEVTAPKSQRYALGLGYGTFTGPRLSAGLSLRRLTDTGQHVDLQLRLSSVLSGMAAKYYIPGRDPLNDTWALGANYQRFVPKNGQSTSKTVYGGYTTKKGHWQLGANLNLLTEHYYENNLPSRHGDYLYPSVTINYTKTNDILKPTHGKSVNLTLQGASQHVLSSTDFIQADLRAKYLATPLSFARFIVRGEVGYTVVHDLTDLPLTLRFFAGGMNSIRGFPEDSIGPGKYSEVMSMEYQNRVVGDWWGALFEDIGTATDHFGQKMNRGIGVGVVYVSFIGPIKVYLARAISKPQKPLSVEFSIGPEFQ